MRFKYESNKLKTAFAELNNEKQTAIYVFFLASGLYLIDASLS